jgi:hypothetical protein
MIHFITYSGDNMSRSREVCVQAAKEHGAVVIHEYTNADIDNHFYINNIDILNETRGIGFWLWKPYFINEIILALNDGNILIYCDAGVKIIENVNRIIEVMDQDIFLFSNGHQHIHWCKADVMQAILGRQIDDTVQQVQASVIFFKVNRNTRNLVKEWLLWCQMPGFIDDSPSKLPNHPEFAQHRYDQAILTCMAIKYGYKQHWWADKLWYESQRYRWPEDHYPVMFEHHRKRNQGAKTNPEGPTW